MPLSESPRLLPTYSKVACIGTGISAIALGAQLKRWYAFEDIQFFERHTTSAGTWWINSYPGCACDVPSVLYSLSFEQNPAWTKFLPSNTEIRKYSNNIADKYDLPKKMSFQCDVERCDWRDDVKRWILTIRDLKTDIVFVHECQVLFSAAGQLVQPNDCNIPGAETFRGALFHSARWDHSVSIKDKKVVLIGNGCTATQIVPAIEKDVKHLTQMIRTNHWIFPSTNIKLSPRFLWCLKHIPFAMALQRFLLFCILESELQIFYMTKNGARARKVRRERAESYMRATAPAKYHDMIMPDFEVGCKRRIIDCGYLESLHSDKITLTTDHALEIVPEGICTANGIIEADVIVLATGYKTHEFLDPIKIHGRGGVSLTEHWKNFGGPSAYNCTAMSEFPNFFMLLGPNSATGHTSALMASENMINYALRILKPVFRNQAESVEVRFEAEKSYIHHMQDELMKRVWSAGCKSWYTRGENKWNDVSYPWSQGHFWFRSLFPTYRDWTVKKVKATGKIRAISWNYSVVLVAVLLAVGSSSGFRHYIASLSLSSALNFA
ncbi:hypothetical protein IFR05_012981 [Cadophora sp. M221]|nr:hypothetical protein IFR05_012981 [Cadophora sp. M221]